MSDRTLKVQAPHMQGQDVESWQVTVRKQFQGWGIEYPIVVDGDYGVASRSATADLLYALGIDRDEMAAGVTPALRSKVRSRKLNAVERYRMAKRVAWRRALRRKHAAGRSVHPPLAKILSSSWGFHPPVHDGVDLICEANAPLLAICDGVVTRADAGGWWGKGARPSGGHSVSDGDGIVVIRCSTDAGPFKKGLNFCYGHAERPRVKVGDHVTAGEHIATAGFANAWHIHLMVNDDQGNRGVGDRDPMVFVNYAAKGR